MLCSHSKQEIGGELQLSLARIMSAFLNASSHV